MKQHLWLALAILYVAAATCVARSKFYLSYESTAGTVFFVCPAKMPSATNGGKRLDYDITIVPNRDSVSVKLTVFTRSVSSFAAATVAAGDTISRDYDLQLLYADVGRSKYKYRLQFHMSLDDLRLLCDAQQPPVLSLDLGQGQRYRHKPGAWAKRRAAMLELLALIQTNYLSRPATVVQ